MVFFLQLYSNLMVSEDIIILNGMKHIHLEVVKFLLERYPEIYLKMNLFLFLRKYVDFVSKLCHFGYGAIMFLYANNLLVIFTEFESLVKLLLLMLITHALSYLGWNTYWDMHEYVHYMCSLNSRLNTFWCFL